MNKKEQLETIKLVQLGDKQAENKLIEDNLGLIIKIALNYEDAINEKDDLVNIGSMGLLAAAKTFDFTKNVAFSTYASKCIINKILYALKKNSKQEKKQLLSLDTDYMQDINNINDMDDILLLKEQEGIIRNILLCLNEEERKYIKYSYGIDCPKKSYKQISQILGVSEKYLSSIKKRAFNKLKREIIKYHIRPEEQLRYKEKPIVSLEEIEKEFNKIPKSQAKEIYGLYYGLNRVEPQIAKNIAIKYNLTENKVREIIKSFKNEYKYFNQDSVKETLNNNKHKKLKLKETENIKFLKYSAKEIESAYNLIPNCINKEIYGLYCGFMGQEALSVKQLAQKYNYSKDYIYIIIKKLKTQHLKVLEKGIDGVQLNNKLKRVFFNYNLAEIKAAYAKIPESEEKEMYGLYYGLNDEEPYIIKELISKYNYTIGCISNKLKLMKKIHLDVLEKGYFEERKRVDHQLEKEFVNCTLAEIKIAFNKIPESQEKEIYDLYYGLNNDDQQMAKEIAEIYNVSEDVVRKSIYKIKLELYKILNIPFPNERRKINHKITKKFPNYTLEEIKKAFTKLPEDKEKEIYSLYYGLNNQEQYSLEELVQKYQFSSRYICFLIKKEENRHCDILKQGYFEERRKVNHKIEKDFINYTLEEIKKAFNKIPDSKAKEIYGIYYGLNNQRQQTAKELAQNYGYVREYIYNMLNKMKKLHYEILSNDQLKENIKQQILEDDMRLKELKGQKEQLTNMKQHLLNNEDKENILQRKKF